MAEAPADLIAQLEYAEEQSKYWTELIKDTKAQLTKIAGDDEELTVNGKLVRTYRYTDAFKSEAFVKAYPVVAANYTIIEEVKVLDVARLQRNQPELWREFRSRSFRKAN